MLPVSSFRKEPCGESAEHCEWFLSVGDVEVLVKGNANSPDPLALARANAALEHLEVLAERALKMLREFIGTMAHGAWLASDAATRLTANSATSFFRSGLKRTGTPGETPTSTSTSASECIRRRHLEMNMAAPSSSSSGSTIGSRRPLPAVAERQLAGGSAALISGPCLPCTKALTSLAFPSFQRVGRTTLFATAPFPGSTWKGRPSRAFSAAASSAIRLGTGGCSTQPSSSRSNSAIASSEALDLQGAISSNAGS